MTETEAVKLPSMEKTTASVLGGTTTRWRSSTVWSPAHTDMLIWRFFCGKSHDIVLLNPARFTTMAVQFHLGKPKGQQRFTMN